MKRSRIDRMSPRVRAYLLAHPQHRPNEVAAALGLTAATVRTYRCLLIAAGLLPRLRGPLVPIDDLRDGIEAGLPLQQVARSNGIRPEAAKLRLQRAGVGVQALRADQVYSFAQVARLIGYSKEWGYKLLRRWHRAGLLKARRSSQRRGALWLVSATGLMDFLDDPRTWELVAPSQITDPDWRAYAEDARERYHLRTTQIPRKQRKQSHAAD